MDFFACSVALKTTLAIAHLHCCCIVPRFGKLWARYLRDWSSADCCHRFRIWKNPTWLNRVQQCWAWFLSLLVRRLELSLCFWRGFPTLLRRCSIAVRLWRSSQRLVANMCCMKLAYNAFKRCKVSDVCLEGCFNGWRVLVIIMCVGMFCIMRGECSLRTA